MRLRVIMPTLPHLNSTGGGSGGDVARLWKRVRTLESDLGYSNLAPEAFPESPVHRARQPLWHTDDDEPPSHHRKRRLPSVAPIVRSRGPFVQKDLANSASTPALSLQSEQKSTPWTQPVSQRTMARGKLPRLHGPPEEVGRASNSGEPSFKTIAPRSLAEICGKNSASPCPDSPQCLPLSAEMTDRQRLEAGESSSRAGKLGPTDSFSAISSGLRRSTDVPAISSLQLSSGSGGTRRKASSDADVSTPLPGVFAEEAEGNSRGVAFGVQEPDTPTPRERGEEVATGIAERQEQQKLVLKTTPSRQKLRVARSGSYRSLVSPKNPLISNTVVARVKEGLQNGEEKRPKVLMVGSGTFNPVHKLHIRRFYLARNFLEAHKGMSRHKLNWEEYPRFVPSYACIMLKDVTKIWILYSYENVRVVGGIVSPSHPTLVRQRHRVRAAEIIPPKHRLSMARAAVGEGSWLAVDPWEVTRRRIMDYMSVLEHAKEVCHETFPGHAGDITILYMCQASQIHHLNPAMLRAGGFGVITVCRPLEKERLLKELSPSFRNIAILVEDSAILSAELDTTSSTMVRHLLKQGKSVEGMVGKAVARYIRDNHIAERVSGKYKWTVEDNAFMFDQEDKEDRPYHNLPRMYMRRASQMPLHY